MITAIMMVLLTGDQTVQGYTRKDGTYVESYHRTEANDTVYDNYDHGEFNPYNPPSMPQNNPQPHEGDGFYFTGE